MVSRRAVVGGVVSGAAATALAGCGQTDQVRVASIPVLRQPGVLTPAPAATVLAACELPGDRGTARMVLAALEAQVAKANAGGSEVTVGVGMSLFDDRFGLGSMRPRLLAAMPAFPNDVLDPVMCHGDVLIQVGSAEPDEAGAVLEAVLAVGLRTRWRIAGFQRPDQGSTSRDLFGFREGAGNPVDAGDLIRAVEAEPSWALGGTYQVVRLIRMATTLWNRESIPRQEQVIGRTRGADIPLGQTRRDAQFDYANDPDGRQVALDAHIRRANPRTAETLRHRMLRRGYSYTNDRDASGEPDEGLIFICFQRDPESGFAAAQQRLAGEALERYVLPYGGGYFFVPPSVGALQGLFVDQG